MLIAFAALAIAQAQSSGEPSPDEGIVVMTERLRSVRISPGVTIRKVVATTTSPCKVKRTSGDAAIDALACDAVALCAARPQPSRKAFNACVDDEAITAMLRLGAQRSAQQPGETGQ